MLGTPVDELEEGWKDLKQMATPQEEQYSQVMGISGSSQRVRHQPKSIYRLVRIPHPPTQHICSKWMPSLVSVGEDAPNPIEILCTRVGAALSETKWRRDKGRNSARRDLEGAAFGMQLIN